MRFFRKKMPKTMKIGDVISGGCQPIVGSDNRLTTVSSNSKGFETLLECFQAPGFLQKKIPGAFIFQGIRGKAGRVPENRFPRSERFRNCRRNDLQKRGASLWVRLAHPKQADAGLPEEWHFRFVIAEPEPQQPGRLHPHRSWQSQSQRRP